MIIIVGTWQTNHVFLLGYVEHIIKKWDVANFGDFIVIEASIIGMIFIITK